MFYFLCPPSRKLRATFCAIPLAHADPSFDLQHHPVRRPNGVQSGSVAACAFVAEKEMRHALASAFVPQCADPNGRIGKRRTRLSVQSLEDRTTPAVLDPVYTATFADAVTADNAFTAADGQRYWTIDAGADSYQNDLYERPTAQTYQVRTLADGSERFAAAEYFQNLDIVEARAGFDANFLYVSIKLAGLDKLTADGKPPPKGWSTATASASPSRPTAAAGCSSSPTSRSSRTRRTPRFGQVGTFIYRDANGDVGGTGLDVTKQDRQAEVNGNGYEEVLASDGKLSFGPEGALGSRQPDRPDRGRVRARLQGAGLHGRRTWPTCRTSPSRPTRACRTRATISGTTSTPRARPARPTGRRTATAASRSSARQGLGNIYELDTLYLGSVEPPPTSSIGGIVFNDVNFDGIRNPNEFGISGVEVILTGVDDLGNSISQTTIADDTGSYIFADLRPGTYQVFEVQPFGFEDGVDTVGTVNGLPRGQLLDNDLIGAIALGFGENGIGYDFAEFSGDIS